jgi:hypothetical protein
VLAAPVFVALEAFDAAVASGWVAVEGAAADLACVEHIGGWVGGWSGGLVVPDIMVT